MTFDEWLDFVDEYWEIFGPPPPKEDVEYLDIKL
jgi:hypothetical protein